MKRFFFLIVVAVLASMHVQALNLKTVFIQMPDSILPLLSRTDRMDFIDFHDSGMTPKVVNRLGGESVMSYMGDEHLTIQTTAESSFDLILLNRKDGSSLICVINTVNPGYADSQVLFYDESWKRVNSESVLERPSLGDFLTRSALKEDSVNVLFDQSLLRLSEVEYRDGSLFFSYTSLDYVGEDADRFRRYFRESALEYRWNGKKFKRVGK